MTLTKAIAGSAFTKPAAALFLVFAVLLVQGCGHSTRTTKFASHKVTLDRSGITNRFVEERDKRAIFHYDGYGITGGHLKVTIENEKVTINDKLVGMLKEGDDVHINADDGVAVNSLDYGQTENYLQENLKRFITQNVDK